MGEDGWGHVADILKATNNKKGKGDSPSKITPLPEKWTKRSIYGIGYEGAEYQEYDVEYFTSLPRKRRQQVKEEIIADSQLDLDSQDSKPVSQNNTLDIALLATLKKSLEDLQNFPPPNILPQNFSYLHETPLLLEALSFLELHLLKDETLAEICRQFITLNGSSYMQCSTFAKYALLPKVQGLTSTASRALVGGMIHCAKLHPAPIMYGLLVPLVTEHSGSVQSEVVNRIAFVEKCLSPELCVEFMREIIQKKQDWSEPFILLLTNALNLNVQFTEEISSLIVAHMIKQVDNYTTNPKFAKLAYSLISKCPLLVKPHSVSLQQMLAKCKNFMAKSAISQLEKL